jgi:hypothetical protein
MKTNHRWEPRDADVPALLLIGVIVVVSTVLFALMGGGLFRALSLRKDAADPQPPAIAWMGEAPAEPRLQIAPQADLAAYEKAQQQALHSYGWVDRKQGVVRLPIGRAMDLLLQRGLPATAPAETDLQFRQQQGGGKMP